MRHYWSQVRYLKLFHLEDNSDLTPVASVSEDPNDNVNFFNIDMNYTWQFAPGSFININWKSASELANTVIRDKYFRNLGNTVDAPQINNFSVKIIYFLDYLSLKKR